MLYGRPYVNLLFVLFLHFPVDFIFVYKLFSAIIEIGIRINDKNKFTAISKFRYKPYIFKVNWLNNLKLENVFVFLMMFLKLSNHIKSKYRENANLVILNK